MIALIGCYGSSADFAECWGGGGYYDEQFGLEYATEPYLLQVQNTGSTAPAPTSPTTAFGPIGGATAAASLVAAGAVPAGAPVVGTLALMLIAISSGITAAGSPVMGGAGSIPVDTGFDPLGNPTSGTVQP